MNRNCLKIVSNPTNNTLAFYKKSKERWLLVPNTSDLSRKEYIKATIKENASKIVSYINTVYNIGNQGVDIYFEGTQGDYQTLVAVISDQFPECNLQCMIQKTLVAVMGKCNCGKTVLIEELTKQKDTQYQQTIVDGAGVYMDESGTTVWYEVPGIDLGIENVNAAITKFEKLAEQGLTNLVYCLGTSKLEPLEEEFIAHVQSEYPSIRILVALTQFKEEDSAVFVDQLSTQLNGVRVIPVLARDVKIRDGMISAYGVDDIYSFIFEGK